MDRMFKLKERIKNSYHRFLKIHDEPREIALGLALGIVIGISPIFGVQIISAIILASLLGWNKIAAGIGTLITNPVTTPFIYGLTYYVGSRLLNVRLELPKSSELNFQAVLKMMNHADQALRMADHEVAVIAKRPAKLVDQQFLCLFLKINHDISAKDDMEGVFKLIKGIHEVVPPELHHVFQWLFDPVQALLSVKAPLKISPEQVFGDLIELFFRIDAPYGLGQGL